MNKMLLWWILFIVFLNIETVFCTTECKNTNKCFCFYHDYDNEYEFQCPPTQDLEEINGFIIHATNDKISTECLQMKHFELEKLPVVNIENVTKLSIQFCPLPPKNVKQIIDKFSVQNLTSLSFSYSNQYGLLISKEYFKDLTTLEYLNLNDNGITKLEVDVFDNTPNLISIDLDNNNINLLEVDHIKKLKYLKNLVLARNQLKNIPDGIFEDSKNLEYLDLWNNQLHNLTSLSFMGLINLRDLELSQNHLDFIEEDAFKYLKNLRRLSLSKNKLTSLPAKLLTYNNQLEEIKINNNVNFTLSKLFFSNLKNLRAIDLSNLNLTSIPNDVFFGANNLKNIILSGNSLKVLPADLFVDTNDLEELHLNRNNFEILETPFKKLKKLKFLNLDDNLLTKIEQNLFKDLTFLEVLSLNRNKITYIDSFAFFYNKNLKEIYVANNNFSSPIGPNQLFRDSKNLEVIDFSYNKISVLDSVNSVNVNLKHLDLSYNHLTSIRVADLDLYNIIINLENNDIKEVNFEYVEERVRNSRNNTNNYPTTTTILLSKNPLVCDCSNYDLLRYLKRDFYDKTYDMFKIQMENVTCTQPEDTQGTLFEKLLLIDITCPRKQIPLNLPCPKNCQCIARPYDKSYIVNCSHNGLSTYPTIEFTPSSILNQVELHLEFNNFTSGPSSVEVDKYYSSVTRLYLSNNYINHITSIPAKLHLLQLHNNSLERLDDEFLEYLNTSSISNLTLDENPWICECNKIEKFAQYLRNHAKQVVAASSIFCGNTEKAIIDLNQNNLCKEWELITLIVLIMSVLVLSASTAAAYYLYQQEIKVWLFSKQLCLWWVTEEEIDKDKLYDAFISYAHKDEDFVINSLLTVLESDPLPYKICIHFRDWVPGEFITTQVTNSVYESRRTIIVLSSNFLKSVWGKHEFRTAHSQAMMDGRARVIVILYGDVDVDNLDEELNAYLKTNTYIKWGDPYFWRKLKYALPHYNKMKPLDKNSEKQANLKNFMDDKLNLTIDKISSPVSSRSILVKQPEKLKKQSLSFRDNTELQNIVVES